MQLLAEQRRNRSTGMRRPGMDTPTAGVLTTRGSPPPHWGRNRHGRMGKDGRRAARMWVEVVDGMRGESG